MQRPYPGLFSIAVCSVVRLQSIRLQPKSRRWWWWWGKASQGNPQACKLARQPCPQKIHRQEGSSIRSIHQPFERQKSIWILKSSKSQFGIQCAYAQPAQTRMRGEILRRNLACKNEWGLLGQQRRACLKPDYNAKSLPAGRLT